MKTFTPLIAARKKAVGIAETAGADRDIKYPDTNLAQVLCIRYTIIFQKKSVLALFDLSSEVNVIYSIFAKKLRISIRPTNVKGEKIDSTMLDTHRIVVVAFLLTDKSN